MLLPFQVTMASNYLVVDRLGIMDSHAAIILPAVFSTFPVFLTYRYFIGIPEEIFEAFSLDSSSHFRMFWHIGVPLAAPGAKAAMLLCTIEYWNLLEQPLLFLKTPSLWVFSLYLPNIGKENAPYAFVFSFLVLFPMCLASFLQKETLQKGIGAMALKQ
jgi:multiple sugar transport system permease protein